MTVINYSRGDMSVYFKCKSCEGEHQSAAGFGDEKSFEASPMPDSEIRCHTTGKTNTYARREMYWRAVTADGNEL